MSKPLVNWTEAKLRKAPIETLESIMDNPDVYTDGTVQRACKIFEERQAEELESVDRIGKFFENL